jgi:hypothetical protein
VYVGTVEKGQRGRVGRFLNGNALAAVNGHLASVEEGSRIRERCGCGSASKPVLSTKNKLELIKQQVIKE